MGFYLFIKLSYNIILYFILATVDDEEKKLARTMMELCVVVAFEYYVNVCVVCGKVKAFYVRNIICIK
jgi:hypothetical protein